MSIRVMSWVWDHSSSSGNERLVLLALADNANDYGLCWPSVPTIAAKARVSESTVRRALHSLVGIGELSCEAKSGTSNRYTINWYPYQSDRGSQTDTHGTPPSPVKLTPPNPSQIDTPPPSPLTGDPCQPLTGEPSINRKRTVAPKTKAHSLPENWAPNEAHAEYATKNGIDLAHEADQFRSHHGSKGNHFKNWDMAFRTWLGNAAKWVGKTRPVSRNGWGQNSPEAMFN